MYYYCENPFGTQSPPTHISPETAQAHFAHVADLCQLAQNPGPNREVFATCLKQMSTTVLRPIAEGRTDCGYELCSKARNLLEDTERTLSALEGNGKA